MEEKALAFSEERWVLMMADYSADGVWHRNVDAGDADELPVSKDLVAKIRAWQGWFEHFELGSDESYRRWDLKGFASRGMAIAQAVNAELPDFTVDFGIMQPSVDW